VVILGHRVDRVAKLSPVVGVRTPPPPSHCRRVFSLLRCSGGGGGGNNRLKNSDEGTDTAVLQVLCDLGQPIATLYTLDYCTMNVRKCGNCALSLSECRGA
jgi:hypothetical protein